MKATTAAPAFPVQAAATAKGHSKSIRYISLAGGLLIVMAFYSVVVRPWFLTWGATAEEQAMALPGDQFAVAENLETRAITIAAPAQRIWPWLAQLGQDRGGFYSYDLLENMAGCQMPTTDVLRPDKQNWRAGDKLWMYPPSRGVKISGAPLQTYIPGRALGFATTQNTYGDSSWNFILQPIDPGRTRLLVRGRGPASRSWMGSLFNHLAFEPAHFVMEKRTMIGIKQLAEGSDRGRLWNHLQVGLWALTFGLWIASIVFVLRRSQWVRALVGFFAASALFQVLTLGQPPLWFGAVMVACLVWLLWRPRIQIKETLPQLRAQAQPA